MRKAQQKIDVAFYLGRRVGISDAITTFYEQNGMTHENFNAAASMRKEYDRALSLEATAKQRLEKFTSKSTIKAQKDQNETTQ